MRPNPNVVAPDLKAMVEAALSFGVKAEQARLIAGIALLVASTYVRTLIPSFRGQPK